VNGRLLRSLIAERVASEPRPGEGFTVGRCRHCDERVWLSNDWLTVLAGDPEAGASCFDCACTLLDPG
jgi:hypothetical protein